ncbi:MAG: glycosyltransferase family 4 protein [Chloroflexota bacterium]
MKIALVSPYDFSYPGGVTNHITCLERYLRQMGHYVRVIGPASQAVPSLDGRFIPIGKPRPVPASGSICRVTISPWLSPKINETLNRENFDIVHLHEPLMPMLCTTVLRLSDTVNIGTFHALAGSPGYGFGRPLSTFFFRRWFRRLHGRIAVSRPAQQFANKYLPGDYTVIPNGVDLTHFSRDVAPIGQFGDGKINILFVGRLEKRKGLNYLLEAYRQVKREVPECRLIVVGPGTRLRHKYEKTVAREDIKDVVFIGQVSHDELPRYYQTADVFCAPATNRESFGIILLEAMALGKPIVASNIEGYASVLTNGKEGLLAPPRDAKGLAESLMTLLTDPAMRREMGEKGRVTAAKYSWQHVAQRVFDYYQKVLSEL